MTQALQFHGIAAANFASENERKSPMVHNDVISYQWACPQLGIRGNVIGNLVKVMPYVNYSITKLQTSADVCYGNSLSGEWRLRWQ